jgi:hypothetical protein
MERRLAAILAADMVGYSRLMSADEAGTLTRLRSHLAEVIEPGIAEYRGRIVKTAGDGLLAEFPSVVDALRCAVNIQLAAAEREAEVRAETRIAYRVGINLGDIIGEGDDIFGDNGRTGDLGQFGKVARMIYMTVCDQKSGLPSQVPPGPCILPAFSGPSSGTDRSRSPCPRRW